MNKQLTGMCTSWQGAFGFIKVAGIPKDFFVWFEDINKDMNLDGYRKLEQYEQYVFIPAPNIVEGVDKGMKATDVRRMPKEMTPELSAWLS